MPQNSEKSGGLKSVERAFKIIGLIQEMDSAGVTELADHLDLPKSTVHSYLATLESNEYVVNEDGKYSVGLRFLDHGQYAKERREICQKARPSIEQLAEKTGEAVWVVVEEHGVAVSVDLVLGSKAVRTFSRIGNRSPIHTLATGKAILADLPEERITKIIEDQGLESRTNATITDREELYQELQDIRDKGYAFNDNESIKGEFGIGVSVIPNDVVHGAIGISVPANRMQQERYRNELTRVLMGTANEIELKIEYE